MRFPIRLLLSLSLLAGAVSGPLSAHAQALPWKFGMTPDEVRAVSQYAPYKTFSNGDLETYKGVLDGREENFQFFFRQGALRRIGVYLYEGTDASLGARKWLGLARYIERTFGAVETPGNTPPSGADESSDTAFVARAREIVGSTGKTQMAPMTQPKDAFVFSSFGSGDVQGERWYFVVLYFDAPSS